MGSLEYIGNIQSGVFSNLCSSSAKHCIPNTKHAKWFESATKPCCDKISSDKCKKKFNNERKAWNHKVFWKQTNKKKKEHGTSLEQLNQGYQHYCTQLEKMLKIKESYLGFHVKMVE